MSLLTALIHNGRFIDRTMVSVPHSKDIAYGSHELQNDGILFQVNCRIF